MKKAEELQEEIFKKMTSEQKLKLWAGLFIGKRISQRKINLL